MANPLTIAYQAFATSWLGHTSRLIAIAQGIRRRGPEVRHLFVVEGDSGQLLQSAGFAHISLPHEAAFAGPEWNDWTGTERDRMLGEVSGTLLKEVAPRAIVFDSRPCAYVAEQAAKLKLTTVFVARRTRTEGRCFEWALAHSSQVDLIIVPHEPGEFPAPPEIAARTHFVGTIARDRPASPKRTAAAGNRLLITGGGGGFPGTVDFYNLALKAALQAKAQVPALEVVLVTGPMFKEWERLMAVEGVAIVPFDPDMIEAMAAASTVICQAGYNTIAELDGLGTPTICLPAPRVADDQFARARNLVGRRYGFFDLTGCTMETLRDQIVQCLHMPREQRPHDAASNGADLAARLILDLCK